MDPEQDGVSPQEVADREVRLRAARVSGAAAEFASLEREITRLGGDPRAARQWGYVNLGGQSTPSLHAMRAELERLQRGEPPMEICVRCFDVHPQGHCRFSEA
jgi:hypothetical protein